MRSTLLCLVALATYDRLTSALPTSPHGSGMRNPFPSFPDLPTYPSTEGDGSGGLPEGETADTLQCADGLHIVISLPTVPKGLFITRPEAVDLPALAKAISSRIPNSNTIGVTYFQTKFYIPTKPYLIDAKSGTSTLSTHISNYASTCPGHKIALLGAYQGALVVSDVFAGNAPPEGVLGAAVFSSPAARPMESYSRGTATSNGMFAQSKKPLRLEGDVFRSFCDDRDFMCSPNEVQRYSWAHSRVVRQHRKEAEEFIVGVWEAQNGDQEDGENEDGGGEQQGEMEDEGSN